MSKETLGIKRIEAIHYYVHDLERSKNFYVNKMDFKEVGRSNESMNLNGRQESVVFEAASIRVVTSKPVYNDKNPGRAQRWFAKHPDGIGTLVFEVEDIDKAFKSLEKRGATPISDVLNVEDDYGTYKTFSITTPFGGSTFRFVDRNKYAGLYPGLIRTQDKAGANKYGFLAVDHVTSNFETLSPAILWMEHVMGFEKYWNIEFHTKDVSPDKGTGSGLRSIVMWDPYSGVKFANNEPWRPYFRNSQINIFHEDQRGDGIQHVALSVKDIIPAVRGLRAQNVSFMPTPKTYYDVLPERIKATGIHRIDEDLATLQELEILLDGNAEHKYLLQIFLQDSAGLYKEREAGPFFYEIIQRKGDQGFGGGNFRALFESIERQQQAAPSEMTSKKGAHAG